jgi:hypothetical protein
MKKRSFKMATAFAGTAAAAATMGLGPAALAATARPASGSIRNQPCTTYVNGINHWVHLYYPSNNHVSECFGYKGKVPAKGYISGVCSGNNFGTLTFASVPYIARLGARGHSIARLTFEGIDVVANLTKVSLTGWSGHSSCTGWYPPG